MPEFSFDPNGFFGNDKTYCIPGSDPFLLGLLNHADNLVHDKAYRGVQAWWLSELRVQYMDTIPIAQPDKADRDKIVAIAEQLLSEACPN